MERTVIDVDDLPSSGVGIDELAGGVSDEEMPVAEEATPETEDGEVPEAETTTPPKGYVPQKDLDALRSKYDRQVAEANRKAQDTERRLQALMSQREETEQQLLEVRTKDMTEDEARIERQKYELAKRARELDARDQQFQAMRMEQIKEAKAVELSRKYGVPKDYLLSKETMGPDHMEFVAQAYRDASRATAGKQRVQAGTDKLDSGTPTRAGLTSFTEIERAYAEGRISFDAYAKARAKAGID